MKRIIIDSGAYTISTQGINIDLDDYIAFIKENEQHFISFFTMDKIGDAEGSWRNWLRLKKAGVETIPVYHNGTPIEYLEKYLEHTDHIGLGAVAALSSEQRVKGMEQIWEKYFTDSHGNPIVKVHGLGVTGLDLLMRYPWHSVDSFTPVVSAAFGSALMPKFTARGEIIYSKGTLLKVSNQGKYDGKSLTYATLPKTLKDKYEELLNEYGFSIGEFYYQKQQTRTRKASQKGTSMPTLLDIRKDDDPNAPTLAGNWEQRMLWNLQYWDNLRAELPTWKFSDGKYKTTVYVGCSSSRILDIFLMSNTDHKILVSFAYLQGKKNSLYNKMLEYEKNKNKQQKELNG